MKTHQEIFDEVVEHLFNQGRKAQTKGGGCMYRCEDGRKCAVGALIPDDMYDDYFEGKLADDPDIVAALPAEYRVGAVFLRSMQLQHDSYAWHRTNEDFHETFRRAARNHRLSYVKFEGRTFVPYAEREHEATVA